MDGACFLTGAAAWCLVFGLIGMLIGRSRGIPLSGFLFGIVLGPLGWLIAALAADARPKCRECKGTIIAGASRCKNCGAVLRK